MPNTREKPMDRLTLPYQNGNGHYMKYCIQGGCSGICAYCEELDKMVERLAWYEDMVANGVTFANDNNVGDKLTPTADKLSATEWISVKDRLPEYGQLVIVYSGGVLSPQVFTQHFWRADFNDWAHITHWMPLPQPPKGE